MFVKYASRHSWTPHVLVASLFFDPLKDYNILPEYLRSVKIYRPNILFSNSKQAEKIIKNKAIRDKGVRIGLRDFISLSTLYIKWSISILYCILKNRLVSQCEAVVTTTPRRYNHLIGLFLKFFYKKIWVCDYRDAWTTHPTNIYRNSLLKVIDERLEMLVLERCDFVITAARGIKDGIIARFNKTIPSLILKIGLIYNGFDKEDFKGIKELNNAKNADKMVISYAGRLYGLQTPVHFYNALKKLRENKRDIYQDIKFNFVGDYFDDIRLQHEISDFIHKHLQDVVCEYGFLPLKEALTILNNSHILLLVIGYKNDNIYGYNHIHTSKIFEYMYLKKPILALVPPEGEAAEIIRNYDAGIVVRGDDVDAITEAICSLYSDFKNRTLASRFYKKNMDLKMFNREFQTGQLCGILNRLTKEKRGKACAE